MRVPKKVVALVAVQTRHFPVNNTWSVLNKLIPDPTVFEENTIVPLGTPKLAVTTEPSSVLEKLLLTYFILFAEDTLMFNIGLVPRRCEKENRDVPILT